MQSSVWTTTHDHVLLQIGCQWTFVDACSHDEPRTCSKQLLSNSGKQSHQPTTLRRHSILQYNSCNQVLSFLWSTSTNEYNYQAIIRKAIGRATSVLIPLSPPNEHYELYNMQYICIIIIYCESYLRLVPRRVTIRSVGRCRRDISLAPFPMDQV